MHLRSRRTGQDLRKHNAVQELGVFYDALRDIEELVEDKADVDDGRLNLAMKVLVVVRTALGKQ